MPGHVGDGEERSSGSVLLGLAGSDPVTPSELTVGSDGYVARPTVYLEEPRQVRRRQHGHNAIIEILGPRDVVLDYVPRTLWGLDEHGPFTLLDAKMKVDAYLDQSYEGHQILRGVHIESDLAPVTGVRLNFRVREACGWTTSVKLTSGQGQLEPWSCGAGAGVQWQPPVPVPLRTLAFRRSHAFSALLSLWSGRRTSVHELEVEVPGHGWHPIELPGTASTGTLSRSDLLPLSDLELQHFDEWLSLAGSLGPVPYMAMESQAVQQTEVLVVAAGLEGLHRRLYPKRNRLAEGQKLHGVSKKQLRRAAAAAADAALEALGDITVSPEGARLSFREAVSHVEELSFRERLEELLPAVSDVAPGLLGPGLQEWIDELVGIRNVQAHLFATHDDFREREISQYYVIASSGRWSLRILLLLQVAQPSQVAAALSESNTFHFALANIDREGHWGDFSAHDTFDTVP